MTASAGILEDAVSIEARLGDLSARACEVLASPLDDRDLDLLDEILGETRRSRGMLMRLRHALNEVAHLELRASSGAPPDPATLRQRADSHRYVADLATRLRVWDDAEEVAAALRLGTRTPLYPDRSGLDDIWAQQMLGLDAAADILHKVANTSTQAAEAMEYGCFSDIPLSGSHFVGHAHAAARLAMAQNRPRPVRFLDVGCGGGSKVAMATHYFERADGLEYDPGYAVAAERLLAAAAPDTGRAIHGDALTFEDYAAYDVIYFYQPMQNEDRLRDLETRILEHARPGTVLIASYESFAGTPSLHLCAHIAGRIWVTGLDEAGARALRDAAERVGANVRLPLGRISRAAGYQRPLIEALWRTGHLR